MSQLLRIYIIMRNNLKDLFGSEKPSVNKFIYKFNQLPSEKQVRVLKAVREAAFCDWNELPPYYRDFFSPCSAATG